MGFFISFSFSVSFSFPFPFPLKFSVLFGWGCDRMKGDA